MKNKIIADIAVAMRFKNFNIAKLSESTGISKPTITKLVKLGEGSIKNIEKVYKVLEIN